MSYRPWTEKEFASLLKTLSTCTIVKEAVIKHNAKWQTGRSFDAVEASLERRGLKASSYLAPDKIIAHKIPVPDRIKKLVEFLKRRPSASVTETCDALDLSPKKLHEVVQAAKDANYQIGTPTDDTITLSLVAPAVDRLAVHRVAIEPVKGHLIFGIASDLHCASKLHRGACLSDFVDVAMNEYGVRRIFSPGDVMAGINMFPGQAGELECWGMENQVDSAVKQIPVRDGLTWDIIGGNHDESLLKAAGANSIQCLARKRPDIVEHGFYSALIDLVAPGTKHPVKMELFHPAQAGAYALSYHVQKAIEQIPSGMKPQLLFVGHEHTTLQIPDYRGISAFLCGTFEDQSLYLKRKHLSPSIGGWIVDVGITATGEVRSLTTTWIKYFHSRRGSLVSGEAHMDRSIGLPGDKS